MARKLIFVEGSQARPTTGEIMVKWMNENKLIQVQEFGLIVTKIKGSLHRL
ncbi:hypothetical protein [Gloeothece citriformis]|uniref:hypothetical protein n=1 Tax=Gloeothece citriformis TaxID=2546356 RepID=UPI0012FF4001|nr:hypothetical protein [Gloeothece citriformis]